ncbi:hypothetical protein B7463_g8799, partial [Scytalidium lignicola]
MFKLLVTTFTLLALSSAVPTSKHGPPTFPTDNNYTITTNGRHGNGAGPHKITQSSVKRAGEIAKFIKARQGYGTASGAALNWYSSDFNTGGSGYDDPNYYYCFGGSAADFPPFENWMNFYDMFDLNQNTQMVYEESGPIQGAIWNAIVSVSESALVDARFILAIIMQESTGNVYVPCTGYENCGLMQGTSDISYLPTLKDLISASPGSISFDSNNVQGSITQMVIDGTQGTSGGPGLVQWLIDWDYDYGVSANTNGNPYNVARGYNSGSIDFNNLNDGFDSTASYVSDIANSTL